MNIETHLTHTPKSRKQLTAETKLSDRKVRLCIEEARHRGIPIVTDNKTGGYWIAKDILELRAFKHDCLARANKFYAMAERNYIVPGQMVMGG